MESVERLDAIAASFRSRLSSDDFVAINKIKNYADLENAIRDIEAKLVLSKSIRNINKIRPFVNSLQQYTGVIEVFVNVKPDFLALIWGPIKLCLLIASKSIKALDALLDAYRKIGDSMPIISAIDRNFEPHELVTQVLIDVYADILAFHERVVSFFKKKRWELLWRLVARTFEDEFGEVVAKLEHSKRILLDSANVVHMIDARHERSLIADRMQAENLEAAQQRIRFVCDWLSAVDCDEVHDGLRQRRDAYPDTATWIYRNEIFQLWMNKKSGDSPVFWLSGILGAGKTVLFSSIVDHISERFPHGTGAYFYCNHDDESRNKSSEVLKSFLVQLIRNDTPSSVCVEYMYTTILAFKTPRSTPKKVYKEMLQTVLKCHDDPWLAIDGLDECEPNERKEILSLITDLVDSQELDVGLRVLVASRNEGDIERSLQRSFHLNLTSLQLKGGIGIYVDLEAKKLGRKWQFDNVETQELYKRVCDRTQGMFLLAVLIMENLHRQSTLADLRAELHPDIIPHGLEQAYSRIIARINKGTPRDVERIKWILGLLLLTKQKLQVHEIQGALAHDLKDGSISFKERRLINPWDYLQDNCGSILNITKNRYLSFVHSSTLSFLKSTSNGFVDLATANLRVASLCIANMSSLSASQEANIDSLLPRAQQGDLAFLEYSLLHWLHHVRSLHDKDTAMTPDFRHILKLSLEILRSEHHHVSSPSGDDISLENEDSSEGSSWRLIGLALDAQNNSLSFGRCPQTLEQTNLECPRKSFPESSDMDTDADTQLLPTSSSIPEDFIRDETPDQLPAALVKLAACRRLIETAIHQPRANQDLLVSAYGARPFKCPIVACRRFLYGFSRSTERDSHVRTHDRFKCQEMRCDYRLLGFSSQGALKMHNSLCHGNGFDEITFPNIQSQSIWESLKIAIDKGDCLVVKQLCIEAMSIPERPKGFVLRALQKNSFAAAHVLIEHLGSAEELRFRDKKGVVDALSCSAGYGDLDLFKKIMPYFEDVIESFTNSLRIAAKEGHEEIVLIILQGHYAKMTASYLQDIIIAALKSGHDNIVALVLRYGNTSVGQSVLSSAIQYGRRSSVKELLQRNVIPKSQKWYDVRSALLENVDSAVELCFQKKKTRGDVLADGSTVGNALQHAAAAGNSTELQELLDRGADINNASSNFGTAITAAAMRNRKEIIQLLIDHGADISIQGHSSGSALQAASAGGHKETVELLLSHGADVNHVNLEGRHYGCALQAASEGGRKETVELLLSHGADVNLGGGFYGCALQAASEGGHKETVELLLSHGADVNLGGGDYGCALQAASAKGHKETVELLLSHGADVNLGGGEYGCALEAARRRGRREIVQLLLEHGADPETHKDVWGNAS